MLEIRPAQECDHEAIWQMLHRIALAGETYAFDPEIRRKDALAYWFSQNHDVWVAYAKGECLGTYLLRPNQSGSGSHVANAAFLVTPNAQGQGIGRAMAEHCLTEARRLGFHAMQFNFVISTNESAIHLWKTLGFEIVGTLPKAFRHPHHGYVDVYVMFRTLG